MKKVFLFAVLGLLLVHCGGADGDNSVGNSTGSGDNTLDLTVSDTAASESLPPPAGKGADFNVSKAEVAGAVVSTGGVRCVSTDSNGKKSVSTGTLANGRATCSGIPSNQETICYLLNADGTIGATLPISDSGAVGSIRDGFKVSGGKTVSATISYNSNLKEATSDCATANCAAPTSSKADVDITGTWKMTCNAIKKEDTDEVDSSQTCPTELSSGANVYLHRVVAIDGSSVTRYVVGAWPSEAAFTKCGSTEGLLDIPSGWTVSTAGQTTDFVWTAPFATFSATSTSAQIATMLQTDTAGPTLNFSTFQTQNCTGLSANHCAAIYFWAQIYPYMNSNPGAQCWPRIRVTYDAAGAPTFSQAKGFGGKTQPANRYDSMSVYTVGDRAYMKSFFAEEFIAYDTVAAKQVTCDMRDELLFSCTIPATTPVAGDKMACRFTQTTDVSARSGAAADTTTCKNQLGADFEWVKKGSYVDETLTRQ